MMVRSALSRKPGMWTSSRSTIDGSRIRMSARFWPSNCFLDASNNSIIVLSAGPSTAYGSNRPLIELESSRGQYLSPRFSLNHFLKLRLMNVDPRLIPAQPLVSIYQNGKPALHAAFPICCSSRGSTCSTLYAMASLRSQSMMVSALGQRYWHCAATCITEYENLSRLVWLA